MTTFGLFTPVPETERDLFVVNFLKLLFAFLITNSCIIKARGDTGWRNQHMSLRFLDFFLHV